MISHIVAVDKFGGIARDGRIPWDLPGDRARMWQRVMELGDWILISLSARQEIPRHELPMPTLLWTHNHMAQDHYKLAKNEKFVTNLDEYFNNHESDNIVVLGGTKLYAETLRLGKVSLIDMTYIDADFKCDDYSRYPLFLSEPVKMAFQNVEILERREEKNLKITQYLYGVSQKMV